MRAWDPQPCFGSGCLDSGMCSSRPAIRYTAHRGARQHFQLFLPLVFPVSLGPIVGANWNFWVSCSPHAGPRESEGPSFHLPMTSSHLSPASLSCQPGVRCWVSPGQWSLWGGGHNFAPRTHWIISGDRFGCHNWRNTIGI